jgi:adenylate kinase
VAGGFVLDGFPRSIPQAEGLDRYLGKTGKPLDAVVKLDVPKKVLIERMLGRRVCPQCHAVYHIDARPTTEIGICDRCGGTVAERADDDEDTFRRRLNVYDATTAPLINYYNRKGLLVVVNGDAPFVEVSATIDQALDDRGPDGR